MAEKSGGDESRKIAQRLFERIYAFYDIKVLAVALELGLCATLRDRPATPAALAEAVGAKRRGVEAILLGLTTLGLVRHAEGKYGLTDAGQRLLLSDSPEYIGGAVSFADWQFDALPRLADAVRTDAIVWEGFGHYIEGVRGVSSAEEGKRQKTFNDGLAAGAVGTAKAVLAKVDLAGSKSLLDVGGNLGVFAATILRANPEMNATVFDLPQVADQVRADARGLGMGARLSAIGGDFTNDDLPSGHDLISYIRIFNSRTEETCIDLLRKAHHALPEGGRCLFYEEHVLPEDPNEFPPGALWGAMFMLISSAGELRTLSAWEKMFREAGFIDVQGTRGKQSGIVIGTKA